MDYRKELEALMAESAALAAFAPTTSPQKPAASHAQAPIDLVFSILNEPSRPAPSQYIFDLPEREHIRQRVENFKAHQERFRREREDYCQKTMKRVRDAVEGRSSPRISCRDAFATLKVASFRSCSETAEQALASKRITCFLFSGASDKSPGFRRQTLSQH